MEEQRKEKEEFDKKKSRYHNFMCNLVKTRHISGFCSHFFSVVTFQILKHISTSLHVLCVKTSVFIMFYKVIITSSVCPLYKHNDSFRGGPKFITVSHENRTCQVHLLVDMEVMGYG
jgi:hypothetical protein